MINPDEMSDEEVHQYVAAWRGSLTRLAALLLQVETVLAVDIEEFRESMAQEDTGLCAICSGNSTFHDVINIPWCAEHQTRGDFVNIMAARRWRELIDVEFEEESGIVNYSIATGAYFTANVALVGSDEAITALALAAIVREERAA